MKERRTGLDLVAFLLGLFLFLGCGSAVEPPETESDPGPEEGGGHTIAFRIVVTESTPDDAEIWISGNVPGLGSWNGRGIRAAEIGERTFLASEVFPQNQLLQFKVTRGGWETVEKDSTGAEISNRMHRVDGPDTLDIVVGAWRDQVGDVLDHTLTGEIRYHRDVSSRFLSYDRDVVVYLPPQYETEPERRFPVFYMHDGQNLFDRATAFVGIEWEADETAEELIVAGEIEPLIIVGVYNTPDRVPEYTHTADPLRGGGRAADYGRFLVEELKPFIDGTYRTLPAAEETGVAGSSLGGIVSMYFGLVHADVFSRIGIVSPAAFWADEAIVSLVRDSQKTRAAIWLDVGTREGGSPGSQLAFLESTRRLRDALVAKGWILGEDLAYFEDEGAVHNEAAWAGRLDDILRFLYPATTR